MKRVVLILIALMLVFSLAPSAIGSSEAQDGVEITFVHIFGDENDIRNEIVRDIVADFTAETGIQVNIQTTIADYDEVLDRTILDAEQGDAAHVVQLDETANRFAVDSGQFVNISSIATEEQLASLDDILPPVREVFTVDGDMWSLPWNTSNAVMYYNRDMFVEAGLDPDDPPQTFDEILEACEVIMASDLELAGCMNWPLTAWFVESWMANQGALVVNNQNGHDGRATEALFLSDEMKLIFNWWKEMADRGYYVYTGKTVDYNGEAGAFITQRFAMHLNSTAGLTNFQYYAELLNWDLGVTNFPLPNAEATNGVISGGASLWITEGHSEEELEAAREFVFYMTSAENIAQWHKASGYFPNRQESIDMLEAEGFWEENPAFRIALDQMLQTTPTPATGGVILGPYPQVREILETAVQSVIDQGESVDDALAAAKQLADREIEDYNLFYLD